MSGKRNANINGRDFEAKQTFAKDLMQEPFSLVKIENHKVNSVYKVFKSNIFVGYYGVQNALYEALKYAFEPGFNTAHIKHVLSKKIVPDEFLIVLKSHHLVIIEKKMQRVSGSTDEKLQTAPFKVTMFEKLLSNFDASVSYVYVLSSWFKDDIYRNIFEYYEAFTNVKLFVVDQNIDDFSLANYFN